MSIPSSLTPLFSTGSSAAAGYQVSRSLRFNSADSAYLSRTPAVTGNRRTWTWAGWVKRTSTDYSRVFSTSNSGNTEGFYFEFQADSTLTIYDYSSPTVLWQKTTTQVFRDFSAWFHVVLAFDSTQATNSDRFKLYINGTIVTQFSTSSDPSLNFDSYWNAARLHAIGRTGDANVAYFNGYLADIHFIDGQALTPSSFTEVSATTGQLIPKTYSGTYTGNSFWLKFSDNSAATAATLGKDYSGNSNNWTPNNFAVDAGPVYSLYTTASPGFNASYPATRMFDGTDATEAITSNASGAGSITFTPATAIAYTSGVEVYNATGPSAITATLNGGSPVTLTSNGWNTVASGSGSITSLAINRSNGAVAVGGIRINGTLLLTDGAGAGNDSLVDTPTSTGTDTGVGNEVRGNYCTWNPLATGNLTAVNGNLGVKPASSDWQQIKGTISVSTGKWYWESTVNPSSTYNNQYHGISNYLESPNTNLGTVTGFCYGASGDKYYAGIYQSGVAASYTFGDVIGMALDLDSATQTIKFYKNGTLQFTQTITGTGPWHPASNCYYVQTPTVFDTNFGQRAFAYTAPSGFKALCDTNLGAPLTAKPSTVFDVITYTGTGSSLTLPNGSSTPTSISFTPDFAWLKGRSGATDHALYDAVRGVQKDLVSNSTSAETTETTGLTAFGTNTFTVGSLAKLNTSSSTYVAWAWNAGGTTDPSNQAGSITSQVRANVSAGFSVVTYTGNNTDGATVGHGLGVTPALVITKSRSASSLTGWMTKHSSLASNYNLALNLTDAAWNPSTNGWVGDLNSSTVFTLKNGSSNGNNANQSGVTYVAYCFTPVVGYSSFGSYVGNGSSDGPFIFTSFRPRWLLVKSVNYADTWVLIDAVRETYNVMNTQLRPNSSNAESVAVNDAFDFLSNGFKIRGGGAVINTSSAPFVYACFAENPFQYARAR